MTYMMEKELVDYINAQRAEAEEFSKQPGCWIGSMVEPSDLEYWSQRAPCGTLKGFQRIELQFVGLPFESCYQKYVLQKR